MEWIAGLLFVAVILVLLAGFPVAFSLGGTALIFAGLGVLGGGFNEALLSGLPNRIFSSMPTSVTEIPRPPRRLPNNALKVSSKSSAMRARSSVTLVGMLLAASTGIVGATVVTMGLLSMPTMLKRGYSPEISAG